MDTESHSDGVNALVPVSSPTSANVPARRVFPKILALGTGDSGYGEIADPAAPWVTSDGKIRIFGTGNHYLQFASWGDFLAGHAGERVPLTLALPDGTPLRERARDLSLHAWQRRDGSQLCVLYAGTRSAPGGEGTRRVYAYQQNRDGVWIRERLPIFGSEPRAGWLGYSCSHHFLRDADGQTWVFYEKAIAEARNRQGAFVPYLTEIFARRMRSPLRADDDEVRVLGVGTPPYPSTARLAPATGEPNGFAVEGARPVRAEIDGEVFYLLGFSSGDFPTDRYGCNVAWSRQPLGPYFPLLQASAQGLDLMDLGEALRARYGLSWGPARPAFFQDPSGHWWMLFHAVVKAHVPDNDYTQWPQRPLEAFHRQIFLAPLRLRRNEAGLPEIEILDSI